MQRPLLSICIPTYNRSKYLKECLDSLVNQVEYNNIDVEIIVSDNNSTDATQSIVSEFEGRLNIKYSKNTANFGSARNILLAVEEKAEGEFCWVIGDDDLVKQQGVKEIVSKIKKNNALDFFYVNYSLHDPRYKRKHLYSDEVITWTSVGNRSTYDGQVNDWSEIVERDAYALTPMYASIFRRSKWKEHSIGSKLIGDFRNVESTYPHTVIFARMMTGKPAYQISYPWVSVYIGQSSWSKYEPLVMIKRFPELLDELERNGVHRSCTKRHRARMLPLSTRVALDVLRGKRYEQVERIDANRFFALNILNPNIWVHFLKYLIKKLNS
jgi:glycosyltransferase involved in cell wall biosynthesis